ncbi:TonB-linked outer membrane protein, SusC/RagA family [Filimonas lacunae]|uniref:TonB-linked outer membrane protein, SusC/RagA family n=1 Tax=Filimonas lacunae TaxID=477680 RepID=A0A173MAB8_9BACT|nr:TonB-dependent receptor [Filimonas lacunae]BAV04504.1 TonB-dependent receptor [Filimonas lacunae]SIT31610.1 TonB-linked outer membrane protein, SusC/RagA family [Filimonas lacunae]
MKKTTLLVSFILSVCALFAQTRSLQGKVTDEKGAPLGGVSVMLKGAKVGTQTNDAGTFTLNTTAAGTVELVFSYTGYKSITVSTDGKDVSVRLDKDANDLNDIVVVGYQTVRRKDLTGSVSSVGAKQLKDVPMNSAAQALAGRLAGVQITGTEGSPDAAVTIRVRGGGSITQDNSPLYIIDGIQVENGLNAISPQDIETIDVLKDASTTAIYGARGANGVVIITTKSGKNSNGKSVLSYNGFVGINKLARKLKVMNPYEFVTFQYERSRGNATDSTNFANNYGTTWDTLSNYKNAQAVDWQDQMFGRSAFNQTHNISLSGMGGGNVYNLSLTSNTEDAIMSGSRFDRKLASFKFEHTYSPAVKIGFNTRYNNTIVYGAGTSSVGSASTNNLRQAIRYRPLLVPGQNITDFDRSYLDETNGSSLALINPILLNDQSYRKSNTSIINLSGYVTITFTPFLSFKSTLGVDVNTQRKDSFDDSLTNNSRLNGSSLPMAAIATSKTVTLNNSNVFTFSNAKMKGAFHKHNEISWLLGQEIYQTRITGQNTLAKLFQNGISSTKALGNMNLGTFYTDATNYPASYQTDYHSASFFTSVNYSFDKKYLLTATVRADGSTKFGEELSKKWGYFPSASVAWRPLNEKFLEGLGKTFTDLKLRVSYGQSGNNRIADNLFRTLYASSTQYYLAGQQIASYASSTLANPDLKWERTISRNLGIDATVLKGRLQFSIDAYINTTKDLLVNVPIPPTSGYPYQVQNVGSTQNKGLELQVNATPLKTKDFSWTANFNISANKNVVKSLGGRQNYYLKNSGWALSSSPSDYIVRVGDAVGSIWGLQTDGFYQISDFDYNSGTGAYTLKSGVPDNTTLTAIAPKPGVLKFKDLSGPNGKPDGIVNDYDRTVIGVAQPKFLGGLNQQFSYKNFDLSVFVNYQFGNDVYNANKLEFTSAYTGDANMLAVMNNRWRNVDATGKTITDPAGLAELNKNATIWSPSTASNSFTVHSWAIENGSFVRISNITVGYTFADALLKKIKVSKARVYATVNNVALITGYSGYDPEVSVRRGNPETPGVDYSAYPRSRSYIVGINLSL